MNPMIALTLLGGGMSALNQMAAGDKAYALGLEQKAISEVAAGQATAVGQHKAYEVQRQYDLMASRAMAVSAAGGSADDIDNLIADIDSEGLYRAGLAIYEAETEAESIRYNGILSARQGKQAQDASRSTALATTITSAGTAISLRKPKPTGKDD